MKVGKGYISFLLLIAFTVIIISCKKEDKTGKPLLPPPSSILMDFDILSLKKDGSVILTNWQYSCVALAYWNSFLIHNCAIPIAAFKKAGDYNAVNINGDTWQWNYDIYTDSLNISARLVAKSLRDSVYWKLYISLTQDNKTSDEFVWLEGASSQNHEGGWWLFYEKPSNANPFLKIEWKNGENDLNTMKYTYINQNDSNAGGYIQYIKKDQPVFDASYTIYNKYNNNYFNIEWSTSTKEGHIKSVFLFGDSNWHCWDSSFSNITCN